jgi:immunity protein 8 of polymorphic toxin system
MISAHVKKIYTVEMDDLERHVPLNLDKFCVVIRTMVGPRGSEGEESFDINVCTPKWIEEQVEKEGFVLGRGYLVVGRYDPSLIRNTIVRLVESMSGGSWQEVAEKVSRIGYWEFEDYG